MKDLVDFTKDVTEPTFTKEEVVEDLKWQFSFDLNEFDIIYFQETLDLLKTLMEKENEETN